MFGFLRKTDDNCRSAVNADPDLSWEMVGREVALFRADMMGLQERWGQFSTTSRLKITRRQRRLVRDMIEGHPLPYLILDPRPGLHIVDVNEAFAATTLTQRKRIVGGKLFDLFPENPDRPRADGVTNVFEFFRRSAQDCRPRSVAIQRYDIRDRDGLFVNRSWQLNSVPIFDEGGCLIYLLFHPREICA